MELSGASVMLWWTLWLVLPASSEKISNARSSESNASDERSRINIHISDHPAGHILLIEPTELLPEFSNRSLSQTDSSSREKVCDCPGIAGNFDKRMDEISSKVRMLEKRLERHLIEDLKKLPNLFFTPPIMPQPIDPSAFRDFGAGDSPDNPVELIIPLTESPVYPTTSATRSSFSIEPAPPRTTVRPNNLLDRSRRRSERNEPNAGKKQRLTSLCPRPMPLNDVKRKIKPEFIGHRRTKRTRRDVLNRDVTMSDWLRALYEYQKQLRQIQSEQLKAWLSRTRRDNSRPNDLQVSYHDGVKSSHHGVAGDPGRREDEISINPGDHDGDKIILNF